MLQRDPTAATAAELRGKLQGAIDKAKDEAKLLAFDECKGEVPEGDPTEVEEGEEPTEEQSARAAAAAVVTYLLRAMMKRLKNRRAVRAAFAAQGAWNAQARLLYWTRTCVRVYVCTSARLHVCTRVRAHVCMCVRERERVTRVYACACTCIRARVFVRVRARARVRVRVCARVRVCVLTHAAAALPQARLLLARCDAIDPPEIEVGELPKYLTDHSLPSDVGGEKPGLLYQRHEGNRCDSKASRRTRPLVATAQCTHVSRCSRAARRLWRARLPRCTRGVDLESRHHCMCLLGCVCLLGSVRGRHPAAPSHAFPSVALVWELAQQLLCSCARFKRVRVISSASTVAAPFALVAPSTHAPPRSSAPPTTPTPRHARRPFARLRAVPARACTSLSRKRQRPEAAELIGDR